ncbi:leucine-rich repeat domain-containing protein [Nitrincola alkalilacustris]|uniref:leucine-rich repeat domain-containing protein n=1 Tax=Nitrincola alkalilacustris TaxID=1571224 RepID=UPI00124F1264|nr:hypothetical protein [Nitrincola alkalilacustris]
MEPSIEEIMQNLKDAQAQRSEVVEPWDSYWFHRPARDFPPASIQNPEEYKGGDRLSLVCTQTELSATAQKRLVESWCEYLPTLTQVKILWFHSRVPQHLFEAACRMPGLESLYIKWSGIKSLQPISQLQQLRHLHLGASPSAEPLEALRDLPLLENLEIENIRASSDLGFLEGMTQLKALSIAGDSNSIKSIKIKTLKPLEGLHNLERLSLTTTTVNNESLKPILQLHKLKHLILSNQFKMEEVATLAGSMPHTLCDLFEPLGERVEWTACKGCGDKSMVMLTGKGKSWLCTLCDADRIKRHVARFKAIADAAANR